MFVFLFGFNPIYGQESTSVECTMENELKTMTKLQINQFFDLNEDIMVTITDDSKYIDEGNRVLTIKNQKGDMVSEKSVDRWNEIILENTGRKISVTLFDTYENKITEPGEYTVSLSGTVEDCSLPFRISTVDSTTSFLLDWGLLIGGIVLGIILEVILLIRKPGISKNSLWHFVVLGTPVIVSIIINEILKSLGVFF